MERIFSYGTLQDPSVQTQWIGRPLNGEPDSVKGFRLEEIDIDKEVFWILVPDKKTKQIICGQVLEITKKELQAFDEYEGEAYQRSLLTMMTGRTAWVYHQ